MINFEKKINTEIEKTKSQLLGLLKKLIEFKSTVENTKGISLFCADILKKIGMEVELVSLSDIKNYDQNKFRSFNKTGIDYKDKFSVIARYGRNRNLENGRSLILNGHLDVVPPGPIELWNSDPWRANFKNGMVFGRGSYDMKCGIACIIGAVMILKKLDIELLGDLIIELVVDEELGDNCTLYNIIKGVNADAVVYCEPTEMNIVVGARGALCFQIEAYCKDSIDIYDRGDKWKILEILQIIIEAIKDFAKLRKEKAKKGIFSKFKNPVPVYIGKINCGDWFSSIPNKCAIEGVIGWLPYDNLEELKKSFRIHLNTFLKDKSPFSGEDELVLNFDKVVVEPFVQKTNLDLALIAKNIVKKQINYNPEIGVSNGGGSQRLRTIYGKSKTIMFGPKGGNAHGANEYVLINSIHDFLKIYTHLILKWCDYKN